MTPWPSSNRASRRNWPGRLDQRGWADLRLHVDQQACAVADHNHAFADDLGAGFHAVFVGMLRNTVVQQMHAQLVRRTSLRRSLVASRFDDCGLVNHHGKIIDLMEAGDVVGAQALIDLHHRNVVEGFLMDADDDPQT